MSANKSFSTETSERYSRALFEVARESEELEKIETDIKNFQFLLNNSPELKNFVHNPTQSIKNQNNVVNLLSEKLNFSKNLKNFFSLLIKKRRIFFVLKIVDSFLKLCSKKRGEIKASLISSKELSENELEDIRKDLSTSMGSTIKFDYKIDKKLIGGLKLQLGSFMIDTSIKNKLKKFEQKMLEN
ncbi:ATP synthase F1 subunit delta [Pelagibacteraceae bacterium]|nr:ATP synthase F1 subunit delta [Pelagibacteraceae bacterium]